MSEKSYPTEGARISAETGKSARQIVLEEAFEDERLRAVASQEATYIGNCAGGRPSDSARSAVRYTKSALEARDPRILASPTAQKMMEDYLS